MEEEKKKKNIIDVWISGFAAVDILFEAHLQVHVLIFVVRMKCIHFTLTNFVILRYSDFVYLKTNSAAIAESHVINFGRWRSKLFEKV